jgi:hypothetical protein
MSFITKLLGMEKVIEKGAELVDDAFHTEEEKTAARQKWFDSFLGLQTIIANESTPTAISRRILAFMIMGAFLLLIFMGVVVWKFDAAWAKVIFEDGVGRLEFLAGAVGATYFIKDAVVKALRARG